MKAINSAIAAAALVALSGCAGQDARNEQPPASFVQAEASLNQAEQAGGQRYANRELNVARQKLEQAKAAQNDGDVERAQRLAAEAQADADYAAATAGNQQLQMAVEELRASLDTLREELRRNE